MHDDRYLSMLRMKSVAGYHCGKDGFFCAAVFFQSNLYIREPAKRKIIREVTPAFP